jgi:transposase
VKKNVLEIDEIRALPDDPSLLKEELCRTVLKYQQVEEELLVFRHKLFGKSSERYSPEEETQLRLFNEAEDGSSEEPEESGTEELTVVKEHERRKRGRKPLPKNLPRVEIIHDLTDEEKTCACCGKPLPYIGSEQSEELEIIPASIEVHKHIRKKYGPCGCAQSAEDEKPVIRTAPGPKRLLPGSIAGPGLLAHVVTGKFVDSLPLYRQEKMFRGLGIELSRATLCNWVMTAARACADLIDLLWEKVLAGTHMHMDETTLQVLDEPGRTAEQKSYMWVTVGYAGEKPIVLYHYHPTRSERVPLSCLEGFQGYVQTDGYGGYDKACAREGIVHVGCFAHARRKFHEAALVTKKTGAAQIGLSFIKTLYTLERDLREIGFSEEDFVHRRKERAGPVLTEFHEWLVKKADQVPPKTKIGEAVGYTLHQWQKLIRYLDAAFLTPDNNAAEQAIRPFVVGRKNWLFSNTPRGAHASAALYSLVETAKVNGVQPYLYLKHLFEKVPYAVTREDREKLLPLYF